MLTRFLQCLVLSLAALNAVGQADHYTVIFDGIIMHDMRQNRALVVRGTDDYPHDPVLVTPNDIDVSALYEATGRQYFQCDPLTKVCSFHIDGIDMRIGTTNPYQTAPAPLIIDPTFATFTPHMSCITNRGVLSASVYNDLPSGPIVAYFEMTGGKLTACNFKTGAFFVPDLDQEGDHFITDMVTLDGSVASVGVGAAATLQVRSVSTHGQWIPIGRHETLPLKLIVENHAYDANGAMVVSNKHFALNHQLIQTFDGTFPSICLDDGEGDDTACDGQVFGKQRPQDPTTPCTFGGASQGTPCQRKHAAIVLLRNMTTGKKTPNTKSTGVAKSNHDPTLDLLAGCANSQWP